jgi:hypothetical protein
MAAKSHPHEGAVYQILELSDGTFGVEVTIPGLTPTKVSGLPDRASAEAWIARHRAKVAAGPVRYKPFRKRPQP